MSRHERIDRLIRSLLDVRGLDQPRQGLDRSYLPELDSLRFFAFLLVFGFHKGLPQLGGQIRDMFAATVDLPWLLVQGSGGIGGPIGRSVDHALQRNGWIGVNLFFCLSGFIITRLLLQEESNRGSIDWKAFWVRRILRIWPLFYVIYAIGFLGIPLFTHIPGVGLASPHAPWFAVFLGNWSMIVHGPIGSDILSVLWSVCVEEQFYLVIPVVLAVLGPKGRVVFCFVGITGAILRRWVLAAADVPQYEMTYDSLAQTDSILSGVLLALALRSPRFRSFAEVLTTHALAWVVGPLTLVLLSRSHLGHAVADRRIWDPVWIWGVALMWVLVASVGTPRWSKLLKLPVLVLLGKISYGLYMWHEVLLSVMGGGILTLAAVIVTSWASYRSIERPVLKFKHKWSRVESRPV